MTESFDWHPIIDEIARGITGHDDGVPDGAVASQTLDAVVAQAEAIPDSEGESLYLLLTNVARFAGFLESQMDLPSAAEQLLGAMGQQFARLSTIMAKDRRRLGDYQRLAEKRAIDDRVADASSAKLGASLRPSGGMRGGGIGLRRGKPKC